MLKSLVQRRTPLLLVILLIIISKASVASAQVWTTHGPEGGEILALAIDPASPSTIYAGTAGGGVFKSINAGQSWNATGLTNPFVHALAVPAPNVLFAGDCGGGVFKSIDGGVTWAAVNTGLPGGACVNALVVPNQNTLYAATNVGVFKSINGGGNWNAMNNGLSNLTVHALAIDTKSGNLYAGTDDGVFRNSGGAWSASGLSFVFALVIDTTTLPNSTLYAGTSGGVFINTDGESSIWNATGGVTGTVNALAIDPSNHLTLYVGASNGAGFGNVFKSSNGGANWTGTGLSGTNVAALAIDPTSTIYAGTAGGGVLKSINAGGTWALVNTGLLATRVSALAIDRNANPSTVFAATSGGGVFKSINRGGMWETVNSGLADTLVFALTLDPATTTPATLYAGTFSGVFKSIDGGANWNASGLTSVPVHALAVNPGTGTVYAGAESAGVFKSIDGGNSWSVTSLTNTGIRALAVVTPDTVYAGTSSGVFKSTNLGGTWSLVNVGLTNTNVLTLAVSPTNTVYAGTEGGVFKSTNGGQSWSAMNTGLTNLRVTALAFSDASPNTVYAGTEGGGVFISTNGGGTWSAINGLPTITRIFALAIDSRTPTALFAGSDGGGVFVTIGPASVIQFSQSAYVVNEGDPNGRVNITLTRSGDTTGSAAVNYATNDSAGLTNCNVFNGTASSRCDYLPTTGTLIFAPGESIKSIFIPIVNDGYAEGDETFTITLSSPSGASLGSTATAPITITDNDSVNGPPTLLIDETSGRAVAFDSVLLRRDPFSRFNPLNFSPDQRTRVMLFGISVDLMSQENSSVVTAEAEDAQHKIFPLPVESVAKVPSFDWLTQIIVTLPDALGDVQVSISLRGVKSNKVTVRIE